MCRTWRRHFKRATRRELRMPVVPDYLTPAECARVLKCSPKTIIRACKSGRLPALNLGAGKHAEFRIAPADLAALQHKPKPPPAPGRRRRRRYPVDLVKLRIGQYQADAPSDDAGASSQKPQ